MSGRSCARGKRPEEIFATLAAAYPWLSELQLRAAVGYYQLYPEEIEERLAREAAWTPERVWSELPFARPRDPIP